MEGSRQYLNAMTQLCARNEKKLGEIKLTRDKNGHGEKTRQ